MADLLTPALLDQLLGAAVGATGAALVIAITTPVRRRRRQYQRRDLDPAPWGPWHESPSGAHQARQAARVVMEDWRVVHGPMSAMQALTFAVEVLSSDNVTGWTDGLDSVRLNVISLARRVLDWHVSPGGAAVARDMAKVAMASWHRAYGPMSAMQALTFAVEVLSSDNVTGWTDGLDSVRLNVISLARRVVAAHQQPSSGRNGAGGVR